MKIIVDNALRVREFGRRGGFHANELRFYYQVAGYDCLVLRCDNYDYYEWNGKPAVALFNFDDVDGRRILAEFPGAPASWRNADLIQVTVRPDRSLIRPRTTLSAAIIQMVGRGC